MQGCTQTFNTEGILTRSTITEGTECLSCYIRLFLIKIQALELNRDIVIWKLFIPYLVQNGAESAWAVHLGHFFNKYALEPHWEMNNLSFIRFLLRNCSCAFIGNSRLLINMPNATKYKWSDLSNIVNDRKWHWDIK